MKIGILTFHDQLNYGGILQAFALQSTLKKMGYEVFVIDRILRLNRSSIYEHTAPGLPFKKRIKSFLRAMTGCGEWGRGIRIKKTLLFLKTRIQLTPYRFFHWTEIEKQQIDLDCIVVGSDMLWNCLYGLPKDYLLVDAPENIPAITYAICLGMNKIPVEYQKDYQRAVVRFHALSVRESTSIPLLQSLGGSPVHVLDPSLLLDAREWESLLNFSLKKKNLLVCYFMTTDVYTELPRIKKFCSDHHCKAEILVDSYCSLRKDFPYTPSAVIKRIEDVLGNFCNLVHLNSYAGPEDFVKLIASARWVVTESYHAMLFSLNFNTNVRVIKRPDKYISDYFIRMTDFSETIHLSNVLSNSFDKALDSFDRGEDVKFDRELLAKRRAQSKKWLTDQLSTIAKL